MTPIVLALGTTHPFNIAGVGLDARIAPLLGIQLVTIVAGISAQNATSVLVRTAVDAQTIAAQFEAVRDLPIAAIHIGALLDARSVDAVARGVELFTGIPVVCDPVIAATGGSTLADDATIAALRDVLFARCTLVTPNIDEASRLVGAAIDDIGAMERTARELLNFGTAAVLVKGGHLVDEPVDVLISKDGIRHFSGTRIASKLRGTGDLLACAIAARLGYGDPLVESVEAARGFVRGCLAASVPFAGTYTIP